MLLLCNRINYYDLQFRYNNFISFILTELYSHRQIHIFIANTALFSILPVICISRFRLRINIKHVTRIDRSKYNIFYVRKSASVYIMYVYIASLRLVCGKLLFVLLAIKNIELYLRKHSSNFI